jgi:hypothetical protein
VQGHSGLAALTSELTSIEEARITFFNLLET